MARRYRLRWWQAMLAWLAATALLPLPWSAIVGIPFALWTGWTLTEDNRPECGWCGRRFAGGDWCCPRCAAYGSDTPGWALTRNSGEEPR